MLEDDAWTIISKQDGDEAGPVYYVRHPELVSTYRVHRYTPDGEWHLDWVDTSH